MFAAAQMLSQEKVDEPIRFWQDVAKLLTNISSERAIEMINQVKYRGHTLRPEDKQLLKQRYACLKEGDNAMLHEVLCEAFGDIKQGVPLDQLRRPIEELVIVKKTGKAKASSGLGGVAKAKPVAAAAQIMKN